MTASPAPPAQTTIRRAPGMASFRTLGAAAARGPVASSVAKLAPLPERVYSSAGAGVFFPYCEEDQPASGSWRPQDARSEAARLTTATAGRPRASRPATRPAGPASTRVPGGRCQVCAKA